MCSTPTDGIYIHYYWDILQVLIYFHHAHNDMVFLLVEARTEVPGTPTEPDKTTEEVESFVEIGMF